MTDNLTGLGWSIASTLVVFTLGCYAIDRWLDTLPWFILGGSVLGMISVAYQIFRIANDLNKDDRNRRSRRENVDSDPHAAE